MEEKVLTVIQETEILGKKIQVYNSIETPLFLAKDVAEWIDYSKSNGKYKVSQLVKNVDEDEKGIYNVQTNGGIQKAVFVTKTGLKQILSNCRSLIAKQILSEIDDEFCYRNTPKQVEFEAMLHNAIEYHINSGVDFKVCPFNDKAKYYKEYKDCLKYETEYKILNYRVDYFFPDFLLIVEYDENAHKYREVDDMRRQYEIEDYLNKKNGNELWKENGSIVTILRVKEGEEYKGIIEIITHLMSVFI